MTEVGMRQQRRQQAALVAGAVALGLGIRHQLRQRRACSFEGRTVLIAGGSRGLGLLMAEVFLGEGAHVTIAARDRGELDRARARLRATGNDVDTCVVDLNEPDGAERMVRTMIERTGRIDVLVNNAGVIKVGPLEHMDLEDFEEGMNVHFWSPLRAMLAAIPAMRKQRFGRIVNIASVGGLIGVPHLTPYCASKFALVGLSDAVRAEVAREGIAVTTVAPGLMRTGSPFNAWFKGRHRDEFAWFAIADSLPALSVNASAAARRIVEACRYGDPSLRMGLPAKLAALVNAAAPGFMASSMAATNRWVLPRPSDNGTQARSGWQSLSSWAPSTLTRLTERAARDNNELPS
jgi:NAD(P)-dependent dehydrogenase (short-subunit alcohol dehydrogenase family)